MKAKPLRRNIQRRVKQFRTLAVSVVAYIVYTIYISSERESNTIEQKKAHSTFSQCRFSFSLKSTSLCTLHHSRLSSSQYQHQHQLHHLLTHSLSLPWYNLRMCVVHHARAFTFFNNNNNIWLSILL